MFAFFPEIYYTLNKTYILRNFKKMFLILIYNRINFKQIVMPFI